MEIHIFIVLKPDPTQFNSGLKLEVVSECKCLGRVNHSNRGWKTCVRLNHPSHLMNLTAAHDGWNDCGLRLG